MTRYFQHDETREIRVVAKDSLFARDYDDAVEYTVVYTELRLVDTDAVVIDGALPEVTPDAHAHGMLRVDGATFDPVGCDGATYSPSFYERRARRDLALARYVEQHPPVDEAAVKTLVIALHDADDGDVNYLSGGDAQRIARRMVAKGYRIQVSS